MKNIKKIRWLSLMILGALPLLSITACSRVSQWYMPTTIGSIGKGPYAKVTKTENAYVEDVNGNLMNKYLPELFSYNYSVSTNKGLAYVEPFDMKEENLDARMPLAWYDVSSDELVSRKKHDDKIEVVANYNIRQAISSTQIVSKSLAERLEEYIYMQRLIAASIINNDDNQNLLNDLFGGEINSMQIADDSQAKKDFYQFNFAASNLLTRKSVRLGLSNVNFSYDLNQENDFGPGFGIFTTKNQNTKMRQLQQVGSRDTYKAVNPYSNVSKLSESNENFNPDHPFFVGSVTNVPIFLSLDNIEYDYYYSKNIGSDFNSDWILKDQEDYDLVHSAAKASWKNYEKITNESIDAMNLAKRWKIDQFSSSKLSFNDSNPADLKLPAVAKKEPTIKNLDNKIKASDFFVLGTYIVDIDYENPSRTNVKLLKTSTTYPSYMLLDESIYENKKYSTFDEENPNEEDESIVLINENKLNEKLKEEVDLFKQLKDVNKFDFTKALFVKYLFSDYDIAKQKWVANTANFLKAIH